MDKVIVKVDYLKLREQLKQIELHCDEIRTELKELVSICEAENSWKGKSKFAFDNHISQLKNYLERYLTVYSYYNKYLDQTVDNYQRIDRYR